MKPYRSHGDGTFVHSDFAGIGENVVFEQGSMVFHAENVFIGNNVYLGHYAILKGYYRHEMHIGDNVWIGQHCFLHGAGGMTVGDNVGIGPGTKVLTARHRDLGPCVPLSHTELEFSPVTIEKDCNIGVNATILPGVRLGEGAQVGAGAVVTKDVPAFTVVAGVPASPLRIRA